ncbi:MULTISPECIES: hypothetical protein [Gammaproteobacteria]|uniref:hypothetical protein n=1 Tax=Gammaproteobacteria TaxID=1236 RepID=UPI000DD06422|nr:MULTISPECIES: hypothetical protein [Gammaproteobacteria]RTE86970.1 hypothetical protein DQX04_00850 [Aliidiomarina sp. B3213]TCZ93240.1 hypothetical protein EYQ95_04450 [Lysobacter sp. N42]
MYSTPNSNRYKVIDVASNELHTFRLYQTNCGATCDFGLLLQKEIDTPLGFRFVKEVWSMSSAYEAELLITPDRVQVFYEGAVVANLETNI